MSSTTDTLNAAEIADFRNFRYLRSGSSYELGLIQRAAHDIEEFVGTPQYAQWFARVAESLSSGMYTWNKKDKTKG